MVAAPLDGRKVTWPPAWPPPLFKEQALDMDTHLQLYGKLPAPSGMATFSQVELRAVTEALRTLPAPWVLQHLQGVLSPLSK